MNEADATKALADIEETIQAAKANGYGVDALLHGEDNAKVLMKIEKQHLYKKLNAIESKIKLATNTEAIRDLMKNGDTVTQAMESHAQKVKANVEQRATMLGTKLVQHLEEEGVTDFFTKRMEADTVAKYKSQLISIDPATGKPLIRSGGLDVKKIPENEMMAYRTAKVMATMDDFYHTTLNRLGVPLGFLEGRIGRNSWNAASIGLDAKVKDEFLKETLEAADWSKIYTGKLTPTEFVKVLTDKISSGIHGKLLSTDELLEEAYKDIAGAAGSRGSNLAERMGKYRTLHIKPEYYNSYFSKWGSGDVYDSTLADLTSKARQMELMQSYGANPENSYLTMLDNLKRSTPEAGKRGEHPLDKPEIKNGLLKVVLGTDQQPVSGQWARAMSSLRLHESATHLAGMLFSSLSDVSVGPMYTAAKIGHATSGAQVQGFINEFGTALAARADNLSSPFKSALYKGQIKAMDTLSSMTRTGRPLRDVLVEAPVQVSERGILNQAMSKVDGVNNFVLKHNPGMAWTDMGLRAQMNSLAYTFGDLAQHSKLNPQVEKWFKELGILDSWDVLKTRVFTEENGGKFIHIDALDDITDAEVRSIKGQDLTARQLANARDEILTNFKSSYMQHAQAALAMPGVGMQASLSLLPRGTFMGEVSRFVIQFKSFPYQFMTSHIFPTWKNQKSLLAAGMTVNTAAVLLGTYMKDLASGKTPRDYFGTSGEEGAVYKNWVTLGTSVFGFPVVDEIFRRAMSKEGYKANDMATMLGPIFGDGSRTIENISTALHGVAGGDYNKVGEAAFKTIKGAPIIGPVLQGHILKGALERVWLDNINEMFNPNYIDSKEKIAELQGSRIIGR